MILETYFKPKRNFDVNSKEDIRIAKEFFDKWSWGGNGCPFTLEQPHLSVPEMMRERIIGKLFKVTLKE